MQLIKVAGAVLNQTPLAWDKNKQNILHAIEKAKSENVSILCLPELCITGYGCEDAFYASGIHQTSLEILHEILPFTQNMIVGIGLPLMFQNRIFNVACLLVNGEIMGFVAKRFLAGNGIHYEPRWFTPWVEDVSVKIKIKDLKGLEKSYPLGDIYFNIGGIKMGFEICEDAWVANRPGRKLYRYGVDILLNPSASHFAFGKIEVRKRFVLEGSRAFGTAYIYANLLGNESGRAIYDGGVLIASSGTLLAVGERLCFEDVLVTTAVVDISEARLMQSQSSTIFNVPELQENCIEIPFEYPPIKPKILAPPLNSWEESSSIKEEEFGRAEALALFDYMRKSHSKGFVISLSGGADSAAVALLCRLMIDLALEDLGLEKFKEKLSYFKEIQACETADQIAKQIIITAYQATKNSGEITKNAAKKIAENIHSQHYELEIEGLVETYHELIEKAINRKLTWEQDDIALQNIQARVRAPSVWMLTNIKGALLLSTSNRSEAAVGYATMDGDTAGGLSPIAGIDKAFLRHWLRWIEKQGMDKKYFFPALSWINEQAPTAELRPSTFKQTDEDDLMPYNVLDSIEEAAIRDKKMPAECLISLCLQYPQHSEQQLKEWTKKFFRLWCRNQWKRERYAPSFHLDDKNLDPKTWCRFPILSGGFEKELALL